MALGQFSINFHDMDGTVGAAKQQAVHISDLLDEMKRTVDAQRESWTGQAADDFQAAYKYCHQLAMSLPSALDHAASTLQVISDGTLSTEQGNARLFSTQ